MEILARVVQLIMKQQECVLNPHEETELAEWIKRGEEQEIFHKKTPDKNQLADDLLKMDFIDTRYHLKRVLSRLQLRPKLWSFCRILAIVYVVAGPGIGISAVHNIASNIIQSTQVVRQEI